MTIKDVSNKSGYFDLEELLDFYKRGFKEEMYKNTVSVLVYNPKNVNKTLNLEI